VQRTGSRRTIHSSCIAVAGPRNGVSTAKLTPFFRTGRLLHGVRQAEDVRPLTTSQLASPFRVAPSSLCSVTDQTGRMSQAVNSVPRKQGRVGCRAAW